MRALAVITGIIILFSGLQSQELQVKNLNDTKYILADTTKKKVSYKRNISAIFLGIGGGISVPMSVFKDNSDVTFGILGRLEFSSTVIFPLVIGGEVTYFNYKGSDLFKTTNLLSTFNTRHLGYGLNVEYSLTKIFKSSFTMPFVSVDVKMNNIKRDIDEGKNLDSLGLLREETKFSVGAGFGFTMFIFDFHIKYNYMKDMSHIGVYTKMKFPIIKF